MAITGDIVHKEIITITPNVGNAYEIEESYTITDARIAEWDLAIAASTAVIVWDPAVDASPIMADFTYLRLSTDVELGLELTTKEGDGTEELVAFLIPAGGSFTIMKNGSYYNHSASDVFGGTVGNFDKIRVKELNGSAAELHILMALET